MKKTSIVLLALISITAFFAFKSKAVSEGKLGDVKYSILPPAQFQIENGVGWVLMDGDMGIEKKFPGSLLQTRYGVQFLPDARGVFIRGINLSRESKYGDPDSLRLVGSSQFDAFQGHKHFADRNMPVQAKNVDWDVQTFGTSQNLVEESEGKYKFSEFYGTPRVTSETRPKNISLYTYIKIND